MEVAEFPALSSPLGFGVSHSLGEEMSTTKCWEVAYLKMGIVFAVV
jgi:hypothetical protein